jgi:hypothetical protein
MNGDQECFQVMPFGPMNAPASYTAMIHELKNEWLDLFCAKHPESVEDGMLKATS